MNIVLGSDNAGYEGKLTLRAALESDGHEITDVGCHSTDSCDYPDFAHEVARIVASGEIERGIIVCGSGTGVAMAANRHANVRAVQAWSEEIARLSREHNDANVATFGARVQSAEEIVSIARAWLAEEFGGGRHVGRVAKIG